MTDNEPCKYVKYGQLDGKKYCCDGDQIILRGYFYWVVRNYLTEKIAVESARQRETEHTDLGQEHSLQGYKGHVMLLCKNNNNNKNMWLEQNACGEELGEEVINGRREAWCAAVHGVAKS